MNSYCASQRGMEVMPPRVHPSHLHQDAWRPHPGWPAQPDGVAQCGAWMEAPGWAAQREWQHEAQQLNPHATAYVPNHYGAMPRFPYADAMCVPVEARA